MGLHYILQHLDKPGTYVRILFLDFSSAFNTIIPNLLLSKLTQLSVPTSMCQWIISFLTDRQQLVRLGKILIQHLYDQHWCPSGMCFSPHCSSPCTPTTAHLKSPLSSSWSSQMTPHLSASIRTVTSLLTDRRLKSWLSGAITTTWSSTRSKRWRWSWTSGETPPPLTIMNSTVAAVESFRFLGTNISQDLKWEFHIDSIVKKAQYFLRQLRKFNLPQELLKQFYSAIIESVLHFYNGLVQLSYQNWPQKTSVYSSDCWANHWYNPPHSSRTALIQSEQKGWTNHSGSLTSSTPPLWMVTIWSALQSMSTEQPGTGQFLPSGNLPHEHLINSVTTLFIHLTHTYLH